MEISKDSTMGLPASGAVAGSKTPMIVMHNGNSEASAPAPAPAPAPVPASTPTPAASIPLHPPMMPTPMHTAPSFLANTSPNVVAPLATMPPAPPPTSSQIFSTPPPYMAHMSTAIVPVSTAGFAALGLDSMKKKRGRPRKYGPDGSLALSVTPLLALSPSSLSPSQKRGRGRPLGSGKNQQLAALGELMLGQIGAGFTPHAITVATGEDIASRIMSFSQQGPRGICILSANGAISSVTLRQPSFSGGIITYEGRFEILSLSGSFLLTDFAGARSRTGGLSVSLAGPDGRVVGGGVAGGLMAASPVQVIVGSFLCNAKRYLPKAAKTAEGATKSATKPTMTPKAGEPGADALKKESESKPVGTTENAEVAEKGMKGGSGSSETISSSEGGGQQAMPTPTTNTSQPTSQMVSEEKHLDNKIPLPG